MARQLRSMFECPEHKDEQLSRLFYKPPAEKQTTKATPFLYCIEGKKIYALNVVLRASTSS